MTFWQRIKAIFIRVGALLKNVLGVVLKIAGQKLFEELLGFAIEVCKSLDYEDISSAEKRTKAFDEIKAEAATRVEDFKDSFINVLIELAVAYLHSLGDEE